MPGVQASGGSLRCGRFSLSLARPLLMGVINVTPDSFSEAGACFSPAAAIERAQQLAHEGADILDVGGESTRPGANPVSANQELSRVMPVIEAVRELGLPLSVDTSKPQVMRAALASGADMINDVNGFRAEGAFEAVAPTCCAVCIMHMQGEPRTMQAEPRYDDVVGEVGDFLRVRALAAEQAGIDRQRILVDPGFGFGKRLEHNLSLLRHLDRLASLGWPLLVGLSRKSMLGSITGREVGERVHASVAAALLAVISGARIVRVHDVKATRDALAVFEATRSAA
jgi:dihydropteroate synthase